MAEFGSRTCSTASPLTLVSVMYCGICINVCPFDALFWSSEFEYAETDISNLLHEKEKLAEWMSTVPLSAVLNTGDGTSNEVT